MKKELYFNFNPRIKCFLHHAFIFGMIQDEELSEYLAINNYIQIYLSNNNWFDFYTPDYFHNNDIFERKYLSIPLTENNNLNKVLINIIINMINKGFYVTGIFNEFYIPFCWHHNLWDYNHKFLLNGFDNTKKCFCLIGYYGKDLVKKEISFKEMLTAIRNTNNEVCELIFIKPKTIFNKKISIDKIKNSFDNLLYSKTTYDYGYNIRCSGIVAMKNKLDSMIRNQDISIAILYLLFEHSKVLQQSLEYLNNNSNNMNIYIKKCKEIINLCKMNINLNLKGNLNKQNYNKIIFKNLSIIINEEKALIERVIKTI